jgi:hypothetical protein
MDHLKYGKYEKYMGNKEITLNLGKEINGKLG